MKKNHQTKSVLAAALALGVGSANAALPVAAQSAVDSISLLADDFITAAWPIVTVIVVASIGIKLFKKFTSKAT